MSKKNETEKFICTSCGRNLKLDTNFYMSSSDLYKNTGRLSICIECCVELYEKNLKIYKDEKKAVYYTCRKLDMAYSKSNLGAAKKDKRKFHLFRLYVMKLNSLGKVNDGELTFDNSDFISEKSKEIVDKNTKEDKKHNSADVDFDELSRSIEFTDEDIENQNDVIRLLGYDPFAGYSRFDQKFLYGELKPYLDEDTLEDQYKLSQIIQLLNNNNQIRKIDLQINRITSNTKSLISNSDKFNSLASIKYKIVQGTDKIAKENSISVKHRGDKKAGKSTLGGLMKQYRDLGFEDAEQDYYDQMKAIGMKRTADLSNKSIIEQLNFDENDIDSMFKQQRSLIQELQEQKIDLEEDIRKLNLRLLEYKNKDKNLGGS